MNALVVYDSRYGNTQRIAQAIADALPPESQVRVVRSDPAHALELGSTDLLIIGSPTQGWRPTPAVQALLQALAPEQVRGVAVACFDTRFRMPRWLTGSAAVRIARALRKHGGVLVVPPESFFVQGGEGPLLSGELERAAGWAQTLGARVRAQAAPVA